VKKSKGAKVNTKGDIKTEENKHNIRNLERPEKPENPTKLRNDIVKNNRTERRRLPNSGPVATKTFAEDLLKLLTHISYHCDTIQEVENTRSLPEGK
jgi:hypothetical protein